MAYTKSPAAIIPAQPITSGGYMYAIWFPEGKSYLFVGELPSGGNGIPQLVFSLEDGRTCVRKRTSHDFVDSAGVPTEISIGKSLAASGVIPKILEHNMIDKDHSIIIFEHCNGGDLDFYMKHVVRNEEEAEVLLWHVIGEVVRMVTYFQTGSAERDDETVEGPIEFTASKTTQQSRLHATAWPETNSKKLELNRSNASASAERKSDWRPISHGDCHAGNVFLDFTKCQPSSPGHPPNLPRVLLGDLGYTTYSTTGATDIVSFIYDIYGLVRWDDIYPLSRRARTELLEILAPFHAVQSTLSLAEIWDALIPTAERKLRSSGIMQLPQPESRHLPRLFRTVAPAQDTSDYRVLANLKKQGPWDWVKISQQNFDRGRFHDFEIVSQGEVEAAEAIRDLEQWNAAGDGKALDKLVRRLCRTS